jgi:hypothetical protein
VTSLLFLTDLGYVCGTRFKDGPADRVTARRRWQIAQYVHSLTVACGTVHFLAFNFVFRPALLIEEGTWWFLFTFLLYKISTLTFIVRAFKCP